MITDKVKDSGKYMYPVHFFFPFIVVILPLTLLMSLILTNFM